MAGVPMARRGSDLVGVWRVKGETERREWGEFSSGATGIGNQS